MTNRVTLPPQDFDKMCKQAERDQEARKLIVLMERVKKQIAERDDPAGMAAPPKRLVTPISREPGAQRLPIRSAPFER